MNIIDSILLVVISISVLVFIGALPWLISCWVDKHRRKRHPEYFKLYDKCLHDCVELSKQLKRRLAPIEYQINLYQEGLLSGECDNESHKKATDRLYEEYREVASWYRVQKEQLELLVDKANDYAKEHNIKWGELN